MSRSEVRAALELGLSAIAPALATSWENRAFTVPAPSVPYQRATVLFAAPDNPEIGGGYLERGFMQVDHCYPLGAGPGDAEARAELTRAAFPRGASFTSGGVTVLIIRTPEIAPGRPEPDRYVVPVKVRFEAFIGS
jgi:hypothetical protein